jgi:cytochrome P450 family 109
MTTETAKIRYANIIPMKELDTKTKKLFPFTIYNHLRENSPVRLDSNRGCWDIFDYEDVHHILKNPAIFSSQRGVGDRKESLLFMDPPKHKQMRNLVNKAFTPKVVNELAGHIAEITNELLDDVANAKEMDVVSDLAGPLPVIVIAELLGLPTSDRKLFKEWSDALVKGSEVNTEEAFEAVMKERKTAIEQLTPYFKGIINERRIKSRNDLISLLLAAEIDGEKLSEEELLGFCILLLVAGNETTTNLITNTVRYITEDISVQQKLRENMALIPSAIEESLRFYPPVQAIGRIAKEEVVIGGKTIKAGSQVISWVASANRDESKFTDASKFIIDRKPNPHLSFGFGIHFCLGAPLARLEANISLEILLKRFSKIDVKTGTELEPIPSPFVFGVKNYPVTFKS